MEDATFIASHVIDLNKSDHGLDKSIIRINSRRMDKTKRLKNRFYRRQPVKIKNLETGLYIIRHPMGGSNLPGLTKDTVALDYEATDALGIQWFVTNTPMSVQLEIKKADILSLYFYYWRHPDIAYQIAMRISMVSLVFGISGVILAILSLI